MGSTDYINPCIMSPDSLKCGVHKCGNKLLIIKETLFIQSDV